MLSTPFYGLRNRNLARLRAFFWLAQLVNQNLNWGSFTLRRLILNQGLLFDLYLLIGGLGMSFRYAGILLLSVLEGTFFTSLCHTDIFMCVCVCDCVNMKQLERKWMVLKKCRWLEEKDKLVIGKTFLLSPPAMPTIYSILQPYDAVHTLDKCSPYIWFFSTYPGSTPAVGQSGVCKISILLNSDESRQRESLSCSAMRPPNFHTPGSWFSPLLLNLALWWSDLLECKLLLFSIVSLLTCSLRPVIT